MQLRKKLLIHRGWVTCLTKNHLNNLLATGSTDSTIKISDTSQTLILTFTGHKLPVNDLFFSCCAPFLFSCSKSVIAYDLTKNVVCREYQGFMKTIHSICEGVNDNSQCHIDNCSVSTEVDNITNDNILMDHGNPEIQNFPTQNTFFSNVIAAAAENVKLIDRRSKKSVLSIGKDASIVRFADNFIVFGSKDGGLRIYDRGFVFAKIQHVRPIKDMIIFRNTDKLNTSTPTKVDAELPSTNTQNKKQILERLQEIGSKTPLLPNHTIISLSSSRMVVNDAPPVFVEKGVNLFRHGNNLLMATFDGDFFQFEDGRFVKSFSGCWVNKAISFGGMVVAGGEDIQYFY